MVLFELIKHVREKSGLSRTQFAAAIGVSTAAVSNYECGIRRPRHPIVQKILSISEEHELSFTIEDFYPRHK